MSMLALSKAEGAQVDLDRSSNSFYHISGKNETGQRILFRMSTKAGEYFYDRTYGFPYFDIIQKSPQVSRNLFSSLVSNEIYDIKGVVSFSSPIIYDEDKETGGILGVSFDVKTEDGTIFGIKL